MPSHLLHQLPCNLAHPADVSFLLSVHQDDEAVNTWSSLSQEELRRALNCGTRLPPRCRLHPQPLRHLRYTQVTATPPRPVATAFRRTPAMAPPCV